MGICEWIQPCENQKKDFGPKGYKVLFLWRYKR